MPTIRLVPRTYYLSNTTYLSVSNEQNMYNNTDNTTYATVTNTQNGTTSYYIYLRDFNFSDIPSNATINSFSIKLKARESGINTNANYAPKLCNNTSQITSTFNAIGTTATVITASGYSVDFNTIKNYGSNFGIRINCRRANRNTTGYMYIYGAEIEVNYTAPETHTITSTLNGDGTLEPLGAYSVYEGEIYNLTIIPSSNTSTVTATQDGIDITSRIVVHQSSQYTKNTNLGTYTLISGGFNGSGETYFTDIVGNGENASTTTSNYYSSGSGTIAVFKYDMSIQDIPRNAIITNAYCKVNGHAESTSNSNEYMCVQLYSNDTALTSELNFKTIGTSNSTQTLTFTTTPTAEQLSSLYLRCRLGYYGGAINGATLYVEYEIPTTYYTYTYTVTGDSTINVVIRNNGILYLKDNGLWGLVEKVYRKESNSWVEYSDFAFLFNENVRYINADNLPS